MLDPRIQSMIDLAKEQVGYHEGRSHGHWNNVTKYAPELPDLAWAQGQPWCAVFTSWLADKTGNKANFPRTASVPAAATWGKNKKTWSEYPAIGAFVILGKQAHIGFVVDYDDTYVYTIEGNTNTSGSAEGDGVYEKKRLRRAASTLGYVYPVGIPVQSADPDYKAPAAPAPKPDPKPAPAADTYTVKAGDTLSAIAAKFKVTVTQLQWWNSIKDANKIDVGQVLVVKAPADKPAPVAAVPAKVTIREKRITESSALASSEEDHSVVYTSDDEGESPQVFAIERATGKTVGTTALDGVREKDPESMAVDRGLLWLADTGDNKLERTDAALYSFPEPGRGNHHVKPTKHPIHYPDGPQNVETLLINPVTHERFLVSKGKKGRLYQHIDGEKKVRHINVPMPAFVSDGDFTKSGKYAILAQKGHNKSVLVVRSANWATATSLPLPTEVKQIESLTVSPDGTTFSYGSEGESSPLITVAIPEKYR